VQGVDLDSNRVRAKYKMGALPIKLGVQYAISEELNETCASLKSDWVERRWGVKSNTSRMQRALLLGLREQDT
jgi:hypothetical protein